MKNWSVYKHLAYLLAFSMGVLLPLTATSAKMVTYIKEYSYQASEVDSKVSSRTIALELVKRVLLEELGTYLISETEVKDFDLTKDRISSLTAAFVMTVILEEKWDGKIYFLKAKISADTDELVRSIDKIRKNQEQSKTWEEATKKTDERLNQIENLKKQVGQGEKGAQEKYAQAINELSAVDWFKKGFALRFSIKDNQGALKAFDKAIELEPNYAIAYAGRAAVYNTFQQYQKALNESEQALKLDPKLPWAFNTRGVAHLGLLKHAMAIEDFNRAIELDPKYAWGYSHRSAAYYWLTKYHQALEDANKAIELDPGLPYSYFHKGRALASLNNIAEAIKNFDKAIELDPEYSWSFFHRGHALLKLNKQDRALQDFKKAASLGNNMAQDYLKKKGIQW